MDKLNTSIKIRSVFIFIIFTFFLFAISKTIAGSRPISHDTQTPHFQPPAFSNTSPFNGFYAGLYMGKEIDHIKINNELNVIISTPVNLNIMAPNYSNANYPAFLGGVALGYGHVFKDQYYIGIIGKVNFAHIRASTGINVTSTNNLTLVNSNTEVAIDKSYILALKPGVFLSRSTLLYLVAGVSFVDAAIQTTANYFQNVGFGQHSGNISNTQNRSAVGLAVGIGLEQKLISHLSATLEYDYLSYGSIVSDQSIILPITGVIAGSTIRMNNNSIRVQMNQISLGIIYHF